MGGERSHHSAIPAPKVLGPKVLGQLHFNELFVFFFNKSEKESVDFFFTKKLFGNKTSCRPLLS